MEESTNNTRVRDIWIQLSTTAGCFALYVIIAFLNLFVLIWELAVGSKHWGVIAVEFLINIVLLVEVVVGIVIFQADYFRDWTKLMDFVVTLLCIIFFALFLYEDSRQEDAALTVMDSLLLIFRYVFQGIRLTILIIRSRNKGKFFTQDDVDFNRAFETDRGYGEGADHSSSQTVQLVDMLTETKRKNLEPTPLGPDNDRNRLIEVPPPGHEDEDDEEENDHIAALR